MQYRCQRGREAAGDVEGGDAAAFGVHHARDVGIGGVFDAHQRTRARRGDKGQMQATDHTVGDHHLFWGRGQAAAIVMLADSIDEFGDALSRTCPQRGNRTNPRGDGRGALLDQWMRRHDGPAQVNRVIARQGGMGVQRLNWAGSSFRKANTMPRTSLAVQHVVLKQLFHRARDSSTRHIKRDCQRTFRRQNGSSTQPSLCDQRHNVTGYPCTGYAIRERT